MPNHLPDPAADKAPGSAYRPDTRSARQRIFDRIRERQSRSGSTPDPAALEDLRQRMAQPDRGPQPLSISDPVATFIERALVLSCTVDRIEQDIQIADCIRRYLVSQALPQTAVVWPGLAGAPWVSVLQQAGVQLRFGAPVGDDLVGISAVAAAVAETGTLVLASSAQTPASTHLLPETHIAIVRATDIVAVLEDVFDARRKQGLPMPRALNLVSGPSRTGDIEQTIVLGAHGPYRVHLIVVGPL